MNKTKFITPILILAVAFGLGLAHGSSVDPIQTINRLNNGNRVEAAAPVNTPQKAVVTNPSSSKNYLMVSPLEIVARPKFYLGKNVKFRAKFDKFSTLGLDYKPAFRSSEKYITLLIQRPDSYGHDIPLSELKIFVDRTSAEKHIDLNSGDEVEVSGNIFSVALGDAWMSVENFTVLKTAAVK